MMDDLLTSRQVQEILKVDRITVYRMLQDGRLKGVKIGQQWRFYQSEVENLLGKRSDTEKAAEPQASSSFPTHCVQTIQDLFSDVSQISALVVDAEGEPLTNITHPCSFCQAMLDNQSGLQACRASWRTIAQQVQTGSKFFTCHAGLQYVAAAIVDRGTPVGVFLTGQFRWQPPDERQESENLRRLASSHHLPLENLTEAAQAVPVIVPEEHARVETWPFSAARAVQSILHERTGFMTRLQQIADLSQIP
jgi:excisionase family DNA binding protein